eukprot:12663945-Alexandrium_andersonii.AAC.1
MRGAKADSPPRHRPRSPSDKNKNKKRRVKGEGAGGEAGLSEAEAKPAFSMVEAESRDARAVVGPPNSGVDRSVAEGGQGRE